MTNAQLSVIAESAAAAVVSTDPGHDSMSAVERAVREAVWEAGSQFITPIAVTNDPLEGGSHWERGIGNYGG